MTERKPQDVEFVEYVIKSIVDHPEDVKVERAVDEMGVLISLSVNPEDMGQVIGRSGGTAKSIRTLLRVIGARNNARVNLKIVEPEGTSRAAAGSKEEKKTAEGKKGESTKDKETALDEAIDNLKI